MERDNAKDINDKSFEELLNENLDVHDEGPGKLVKGTIVRIDKDVVFVDFGYKSEGIIPIDEFKNKDGDPEAQVGDEVEVIIENNKSGIIKVSKRKADLFKERDFINSSFSESKVISARAIDKIKGGYICDLGTDTEIKAFLPLSQVDLQPGTEDIVGEVIEAKIIQNDNNGIVISRRRLLEEERENKRRETLSTLDEGKIINGEVIRIIDQGVFIDIGGLTGFIPIGELSWARVKHPSDLLNVKDRIDLKVIKIEDDSNRITLSLKQTTPDPWENVEEKFTKGSKVNGRAVSLKDFGVFVELEPGIEGLIHISELSWTRNFRHPKEILEVDSPVEVVVIETNKKEKKLSLSLRRIEPSPWQVFKDNNKIGSVITGKIKNVNEHGLFVEVADDLVGLVRPENFSWKGKVDPVEAYTTEQIGQEIDVSLLHVDTKSQKIALGIKQLSDDPWEVANKKYKKGETELKGSIKELKPNGIIVELENQIEGFYRHSELGLNNDPLQKFNIGDEITGLVIGFEKGKRQVNLSIKKLQEKQEKDRVAEFISSQDDTSAKLGDILGEKLKTLE